MLNNLSNFSGVYQVGDAKKWYLFKGHASIPQMRGKYNQTKNSKVSEKTFS